MPNEPPDGSAEPPEPDAGAGGERAASAWDDDGGGIRPDHPYHAPVETPRGRLGHLVQRLFFRDEHAKEQLLLDLSEDLEHARSLDELARRTLDALDQALRPEAIHLFARRAERFRLLRSTDLHHEGKVLLPDGFRLPEIAAQWNEPRATGALGDLSHDERAWLRARRVHWIVPVRHPRPDLGLVGLLLLGRRREGFSAVHRDLLHAIAGRLAVEIHRHHLRRVEDLRQDRGKGGWLLECPECGRCFGDGVFFCPDDDTVIEPTILVDRDVVGRYRLLARLGRGGMGAVYRAEDLEGEPRDDGRRPPVAVKLLTGGDRVARGRFINEARAGGKIRHPAVVRLLDSGPLGPYGAYLAMEYVEGETLRSLFDRGTPIHPQRLARWLDPVLAGVAAAHELEIVHRDLKPENLMLVRTEDDETTKVLDFGLAKLKETSSGPGIPLTAAGMVVGTLAYMSPEQLQAATLDHRTDLFSLGVIVAEGLTGELPFHAESLGEMLRAVATQPFELPADGPEQEKVRDVLAKALEKDPADRYADAETFRRELIPALEASPPFGD